MRENFSIFIVNSRGEMLLQKRSRKKRHSCGLWANVCSGCTRTDEGESIFAAAHRRLREEMGFDCAIFEAFSFTHRNGSDRVFIGRYERDPKPSRKEVAGWKWSALSRIERDIATSPEAYADWFRLAFPRVVVELAKRKKDLVLRDYSSVAEVMENLYKVSNDFTDRWLHS